MTSGNGKRRGGWSDDGASKRSFQTSDPGKHSVFTDDGSRRTEDTNTNAQSVLPSGQSFQQTVSDERTDKTSGQRDMQGASTHDKADTAEKARQQPAIEEAAGVGEDGSAQLGYQRTVFGRILPNTLLKVRPPLSVILPPSDDTAAGRDESERLQHAGKAQSRHERSSESALEVDPAETQCVQAGQGISANKYKVSVNYCQPKSAVLEEVLPPARPVIYLKPLLESGFGPHMTYRIEITGQAAVLGYKDVEDFCARAIRSNLSTLQLAVSACGMDEKND